MFAIAFSVNLMVSCYPVYFWKKSASMLGGITGPYLAYLKLGETSPREHDIVSITTATVATAGYFFLIFMSAKVEKKFSKSPLGISTTNSIVFIAIVLISLGIVFWFI